MEAADDENNMQAAGRGGAVPPLKLGPRNARQLSLVIGLLALMLAQDSLWGARRSAWRPAEAAVSVQRLSVPELIVIDQFNQQLQAQAALRAPGPGAGGAERAPSQPEAARLTGPSDHNNLFDCLVSYDRDKDSNLVVKWYHDDKPDAIYQWIPELHASPSIAPHYKPYIAPLRAPADESPPQPPPAATPGRQQLLRAAFKLVRPSKDFNGKYKCVATSSQNDDSKWKKMIVFTPPTNFRFNVSRLESRLAAAAPAWRRPTTALQQQQASSQMPTVYRLKGFEMGQPATPDYVNLSQQRSRFRSAGADSNNNNKQPGALKLVCDIDQVFPLPEVTIYRLAKPDGSHPDRLANQEAQRQRNPATGLYSVQVTGFLDDDELARIKYAASTAGEPIYFECLIALSDLQLSKYDNKRTILYRPEALLAGEDISGTSAANSTNTHPTLLLYLLVLLAFLLPLPLTSRLVGPPLHHLSTSAS